MRAGVDKDYQRRMTSAHPSEPTQMNTVLDSEFAELEAEYNCSLEQIGPPAVSYSHKNWPVMVETTSGLPQCALIRNLDATVATCTNVRRFCIKNALCGRRLH